MACFIDSTIDVHCWHCSPMLACPWCGNSNQVACTAKCLILKCVDEVWCVIWYRILYSWLDVIEANKNPRTHLASECSAKLALCEVWCSGLGKKFDSMMVGGMIWCKQRGEGRGKGPSHVIQGDVGWHKYVDVTYSSSQVWLVEKKKPPYMQEFPIQHLFWRTESLKMSPVMSRDSLRHIHYFLVVIGKCW